MMRINLLPIKAERKRDTARQELIVLGAVIGGLVVLLFLWSTIVGAEVSDWQEQVRSVQAALEAQKKDVRRVEDFKKKTEFLEHKKNVIQGLKDRKIGPARMLDELATILTDQKKVWLTKLEEKDGKLMLEGGAMEHENISEFQTALGKRGKLFRDIKLGVISTATRDGLTFIEWKMALSTDYTAG
jgi:type IV pilus assembly protein PilN